MSLRFPPTHRWRALSFFFLAPLVLAAPAAHARRAPAGYEYVSPVPDARYVSPRNNLILRTGLRVNRGDLHQAELVVEGSVSGAHTGSLDLSDDHETVLFQPDQPFTPGEDVHVRVMPKDHGNAPQPLPALDFHFGVGGLPGIGGAAATALRAATEGLASDEPELVPAAKPRGASPDDVRPPEDEPPGEDVPKVVSIVNTGPTPGHLFLAAFRGINQEAGFLYVLDEYRKPVFLRKLPRGATDFKAQPNGWITYWTSATLASKVPRYYVLDSRTDVVDSIEAGNGYTIDLHELRVLPNGHLLLMCYDPQTVAMDAIVPGGRPNATVIGLVLQELDLQRRVVFQWRSWDAYAFTDLVDRTVNLTLQTVDWVHGNSITVDRDGDLVVSARHMNEVTKISRRTGEVVWRLGGRAKSNQFTILGDPRGFSHQHHARIQPDGHLTLFDNGNDVVPNQSRALEYELDENAKTAKLVCEYHHTPNLYGGALGDVQKLTGGGTMICWGATAANVKFSELDAAGHVVYDAGFAPNTYNTYRALKGPWHTTRIATDVAQVDFGTVPAGEVVTRAITVTNPGPDSLRINSFATGGDAAFAVVPPLPVTLAAGASVQVGMQFTAPASGTVRGKLYVGNVSPTSILLQEVELTGRTGDAALAAVHRGPTTLTLQAPAIADPAQPAGTIRFSLPRDMDVDVAVFDVRGRRVTTLARGRFAAGEHAATWDSSAQPSGIYFVAAKTANGTITRKLAVVR